MGDWGNEECGSFANEKCGNEGVRECGNEMRNSKLCLVP